MSNIDKQAVQAVADLKAGYTLGHADVAILNELARIALASLEAEPVAWLLSGGGAKNNVSFDSGNAYADPLREVTPLYTAPPAPVSVPDDVSGPLAHAYKELTPTFMRNHIDVFERYGIYPDGSAGIQAMRIALDGMNRRAAMLQGADEKPELTVWYGSMPESNGKANWTAILHRKGEGRCMDGFTIDRSEYPGRVLYAADRVRYLIGEKSERPSILDYDADAHSGYVKTGNSPVTPDGWVMVPEEPTHEMLEAGDEQFGTYDVYRRMIAAAPQQEISHALAKGMERYGNAMHELAKKEVKP
ncbi:hypothetical protein [Enterobacter hormaechei]|uniref:hypothetical protein n=1 Tax=Enterobacter hormaechei TaxID=158836 RepID=UPI0022370C9B|nr:hypothetical protein [Enterobacter hormaechei]MCW4839303.1 hypothetical protein [Enterobacter hormaechei subsp. xiangfangensis]